MGVRSEARRELRIRTAASRTKEAEAPSLTLSRLTTCFYVDRTLEPLRLEQAGLLVNGTRVFDAKVCKGGVKEEAEEPEEGDESGYTSEANGWAGSRLRRRSTTTTNKP